MHITLPNGWRVLDRTHPDAIAQNLPWLEDEGTRAKQHARSLKPADETWLGNDGTWIDTIPADELGAMHNLSLYANGDLEYVTWGGDVYGPFTIGSSHAFKVDGVIVVSAYREGHWIIAQREQHGPFRHGTVPRFHNSTYFHLEPRLDGSNVVVYGNREHRESSSYHISSTGEIVAHGS